MHTTRDFQRTTLVSPLPQQTIFQRPTLSSTTRALRQVIPVSLRIKLRGLSIPAILTITLSLDLNTLVLGPQITSVSMFQRYSFGHRDRHDYYYTIVTFQIVSDQHPGASIPLVDVSPSQAVLNPILTNIHILIDSAASAEVHTTVLLPRPPAHSRISRRPLGSSAPN